GVRPGGGALGECRRRCRTRRWTARRRAVDRAGGPAARGERAVSAWVLSPLGAAASIDRGARGGRDAAAPGVAGRHTGGRRSNGAVSSDSRGGGGVRRAEAAAGGPCRLRRHVVDREV